MQSIWLPLNFGITCQSWFNWDVLASVLGTNWILHGRNFKLPSLFSDLTIRWQGFYSIFRKCKQTTQTHSRRAGLPDGPQPPHFLAIPFKYALLFSKRFLLQMIFLKNIFNIVVMKIRKKKQRELAWWRRQPRLAPPAYSPHGWPKPQCWGHSKADGSSNFISTKMQVSPSEEKRDGGRKERETERVALLYWHCN